MFFQRKTNNMLEISAKQEFRRLWNEELMKNVDSRDFSKAYNYAVRKRTIKDWAIRNFFDFESEDSVRFKEACDAFDDCDILWTFLLIREFSTIPGYERLTKSLTNKRRIFLSDKRKESVISRQSIRLYMHELMKTSSKAGEDFIKSALQDMQLYEDLKAENKYKSAYEIAVLTNKTGEYTSNIKKYLYYAAKRPVTPENKQQTLAYFNYVERYYNLKRKLYGGGYITIKDIDVISAMIVYMRNGGDISPEVIASELHRTVKVYCKENIFAPIYPLADYLYQTGEIELEQILLKLLTRYGNSINEKYKKRYACLELMSKDSGNFIFRHKARIPLECVVYDEGKDESIENVIKKCYETKETNNWCLVIKRTIKTYPLNYKFYYDDKLLTSLEDILDDDFGDYVLEYAMRTYFSGDELHRHGNRSMILVTSGQNRYANFPKTGIMVKIEQITKKYVNVNYCVLYLPSENYSKDEVAKDSQFIRTILSGETDSRYQTFSTVLEDIIWKTVDNMLTSEQQ